ncbi:DUF1761 domain-containing protein [Paraflavitalea sp. CAU 1676]|uniref:DUF1761 domain-containing protein n=1 Tax=Paraflavitalea sp. CAU 1676 TaxID=3032598 RepID=UPI0023DA7F72|nr:DUF1761 domain-containing protein [Paraflavitalea sp. CAU 1676]MDF2190991.1 DUF1761 domain-containing protein [Paraflavitalea sp. CAU 1676]
MNSINWLAVLVAGISAFVLGGVWYSPALFGKAWMKENQFTVETVQKGNKAKIFGWAFVLSLLMAANLAMFLAEPAQPCPGAPVVNISWGSTAGFLAGFWVFCSIAIVGLFEHKSARYIFINGGYCVLALVLMGAIIGAWR